MFDFLTNIVINYVMEKKQYEDTGAALCEMMTVPTDNSFADLIDQLNAIHYEDTSYLASLEREND